MNMQDILSPIQDLFYWSFRVLEAGNQNFNYLLEAAIAISGIYWIGKLLGYERGEVPNRK